MEMLTVYMVKRQSDMTEGRGVMLSDKCFLKEDDAWEYADTKAGVFGCKPKSGSWRDEPNNYQWMVEPVEVYVDSLVNYENQKAQKVQTALDKLSDEEKSLLGLTD